MRRGPHIETDIETGIESDLDTTIARRWVSHAESKPDHDAIVVWRAGESPFRWTWRALLDRASALAAQLEGNGVEPGHVCALCIRHHCDFYPLYFAVELLGAIPAVLAYPNARLHPDKFRHGIRGMSTSSGLDWFLTEASLEPVVRDLVTEPGSTIRDLLFPLGRADAAPPAGSTQRWLDRHIDPDAECLLQHSSGTTGLQKGVMLSHRAVLAHVERYGRAIGLRDDDKVVSWLPLYHDMGLIAAFHTPLARGITTVQVDPFEWVMAPGLLLEAAHAERATLSWLPNFAYSFMADRVRDEDIEDVRLDSLRLLINCSEPVRDASHRQFLERFASRGARPEMLATCYAMAETTFAVTQSRVGRPPDTRRVGRSALAAGVATAPAAGEVESMLVSSGHPIDGCEVRVVDQDGRDVPPDRTGEIAIKSVSLFNGYRHSPEKTAAAMRDGWFMSGDIGFLDSEGRGLFVIGRRKDLIIVAGKNIYPEDIEDAVGRLDGVLAGRVVAFGADDPAAGTQMVCVVAETELAQDSHRTLRLAVLDAGMGIDITISRVYLVPPRWLIKSSAGKPSRGANAQRALTELHPTT